MFWSHHILVAKHSNFALIWRYIHDSRNKNKVRNELLQLDIIEVCKDLMKYIPSGIHSATELQTKMSLYLLGQLYYGITLVYQVQVDAFLRDAHDVAKSMLRVSEPEKKVKKRTANELDFPIDAEEQATKKRRSAKTKIAAILDLNDPNNYVVEPPLRQPVTDPYAGIDDMFGEEVPPGGRPRTSKLFREIEEELNRSLRPEDRLDLDTSLRNPKVSMGWADFQEGARGPSTPRFDVSPMRAMKESFAEASSAMKKSYLAEPPAEPVTPTVPILEQHDDEPVPQTVPIFRQPEEELIPESQLSQNLIHLDPLPQLQARAEGKKKKRRLTIFDEEIAISSEEIMQQLNDYSGLVRTREKRMAEIEALRQPSLIELLNPRPPLMPVLSEELYSLFDAVLKNVRDKPLTFEEAGNMGIDELRRRRFDFDLPSWGSEQPVGQELPQLKVSVAQMSMSPVRVEQPLHEPAAPEPPAPEPPVLEPPIVEPMQENEEEERHRRMSSVAAGSRRTAATPAGTLLTDEEGITQHLNSDINFDAYNLIETREGYAPVQLEAQDATMPAIPPGIIEKETEELYGQIVAQKRKICVFAEVIGKVSKRAAARKFMALLYLLKRQEIHGNFIKAKQQDAFGDILVKLKPVNEDDAE
ncbi:meiotic recombination protein REC8 like protein [Ditylenchus destructor]|uniref:Meiotic recombination protein REC8 like protein n=1 Tax=Ditylenchus destructor TaxID=166010 RepID=A0AAD4N6Y0_9BILA|nr:meiotic recombination protein REC8 like protein [Ditylenchus destructor]